MKYPIIIPSRGRAGDLLTIQSLPQEFWKYCFLVVPEEELESYKFFYRTQTSFLISGGIILSCSNYGHTISQKRKLMVEEICGYQEIPYFWMMDDDLKFFRRGGQYDTSLTGIKSKLEFDLMFGQAENMVNLEPDRFCAIGISMRQGNNNQDWPIVHNTRLIRCGLFRTEAFLKAEHNRLRFMGDFDVMIQMLKMGYDNSVITAWAQDHRATNAKGGCETSRDEQAMEESANGLAALHPDCVKTKQKVNKGGKLAVRTDVTIYWKKARASASH